MSELEGEIDRMSERGGERECVCVYIYLYNVPRADIVHVLHMRSADFQPRTDTLEVRCLF